MVEIEIKNNKLCLGGIKAEKLVKKFSSPLYVYEEDTIRQKYRELKENINYNKLKILFACKANTNAQIMKILLEEDAGIDAVSVNEIKIALKAGFKKENILFTGNNMTDNDMNDAHKLGILLNIGSLSRLEKFGKKYSGSKVCVRINPDITANVHKHFMTGSLKTKFGIYMDHVDKIKEIIQKYNLKLIGIHCHLGTTIMDPETFFAGMDIILNAAKQFENLEFVDIGGGFGIPYKPNEKPLDINKFGEGFRERTNKFNKEYKKEVGLWIEPGRYLVCQSGFLLSEVNTIKKNPERTFIGLDTNMAHLPRPVTYDAYHKIINASNVEGETEKVDVVGNICETGDFIGRDREITKTKEGDIYAILDAGAYGYSQSSNYNSFCRPAEVLVKNGKARLIRTRETFEDITRNQIF